MEKRFDNGGCDEKEELDEEEEVDEEEGEDDIRTGTGCGDTVCCCCDANC